MRIPPVGKGLMRTWEGREIDLIEEREGRLFAYEFKWTEKSRGPKKFLEAYPEAAFKVQAGYNFPWDIMASLNYVYQTGTPLFTLVRIFGLNQDPPDTGRTIMAEPRSDDKRLKAWSMLGFRLEF